MYPLNRRKPSTMRQLFPMFLSVLLGAETAAIMAYTILDHMHAGTWVWERPPFRTLPASLDDPTFQPVQAPDSPPKAYSPRGSTGFRHAERSKRL